MDFIIVVSPKQKLYLGKLGAIVSTPEQALVLDKYGATMLLNALVREYPHARMMPIVNQPANQPAY